MSEKRYKKRTEFQEKMISRQSEQIESLKSQIIDLKLENEEKDKLINSIDSLREEFIKDIEDIKRYKKEYHALIKELKNMRKILDQTVYKGRWKLVKFIIK